MTPYKFVTREEIAELGLDNYDNQLVLRLLAERDAYREVAIQERKDFEEAEDKATVEGGFKGKHRAEIPDEIDAEAARLLEKGPAGKGD